MQALVTLKPIPQIDIPSDGSMDYLFGSGPISVYITEAGLTRIDLPGKAGRRAILSATEEES